MSDEYMKKHNKHYRLLIFIHYASRIADYGFYA